MRFLFRFFDPDMRERFRTECQLDEPVAAFDEARRIAEMLVTDLAYVCDFSSAHIRIENDGPTISMRFSIAALLERPNGRSPPDAG